MPVETLEAETRVAAPWRWNDYVAEPVRAAVSASEFVDDVMSRVRRRALDSRPTFERAVAPVGCRPVQSTAPTDRWFDADDATCRALFVDSVGFLRQFTQLAGE